MADEALVFGRDAWSAAERAAQAAAFRQLAQLARERGDPERASWLERADLWADRPAPKPPD